MSNETLELDYQRFWRRLQQIGLNAYEARSYLVLIGHPRFKALELAARAHVPRQKIYEVLDSLVEKGFAQVVQEKTKLFSAVEPGLAVPAYLERQKEGLEQQLASQRRHAHSLVQELKSAYTEGQGGRGTLDYLRIVSDPAQIATFYRSMLNDVQTDYCEFSRPPYAVDPLDEQLVRKTRARGVACRILMEAGEMDEVHRTRLADYSAAGIEIKHTQSLPMKLALFDGTQGMIALLDPVITRPAWTAVVFDHAGMGEAMRGMFDGYWKKA
jgi:sugar-specific transcriptional regulator TrmB